MKRVVLFVGGIETLEYFSIQMAKVLEKRGHKIFLFNLEQEEDSYEQLILFIRKGNTLVITFNFNGIRGEVSLYNENEISIWEEWEIPCYNIVVDHPFYYHELLEQVPHNYHQISIDRDHQRYMKRFFQELDSDIFLPLAGTELIEQKLQTPIAERRYDIVFTGNYTPPKTFEKHITRINEEYTQFYYGIIDDLIANPNMTMEYVFEKHLRREMPDIREEDLKILMGNMIFIDLYVRFYFRGLVIQTLADAGFQIQICGNGWDLLKCKHPENMHTTGFVTTEVCLSYLLQAKISLNVMPWFKDGAHDRIFSSMLNGAVCVSDDSEYLRQTLKNGENIVFYSLDRIEELPLIIKNLLADEQELKKIADCAYQTVYSEHTWEGRILQFEAGEIFKNNQKL